MKRLIDKLNGREKDSLCAVEVSTGRKWTTSEFAAIVNSLANILRSNYSHEILVCEENCAELMFLYFAGMVAGKVIIPIDPEKEEAEVKRICEIHLEADMLQQGDLINLVKRLDINPDHDIIAWEKVDMEALFLVTYTSGSTGKPKGVMHSAYNLFASAEAFAELMEYGTNTNMGHCMPMTYMAGILNTLFLPYLVDGCATILPRFSMQNAFRFWKTIQDMGVNTLWLSPTMLRILNMLDKKAVMKEYFHMCGMKLSIGTAPLDKNLRDDFEKKYEMRLYQSYGLSETLFISSEVPEEKVSKHTVGRLLPCADISLASDGEICLTVPWMFLGYMNEDMSSYMNGKAYLTGDLGAFVDKNLVISGRKKDLIVRGGYNVNPRDIENFVLEQGYASECAVVSVMIKGEESIVCCLIPSADFDASACNVSLTSALGKHCKIDLFEQVNSLPKNLNGKMDKIKIKEEMGKKYGS